MRKHQDFLLESLNYFSQISQIDANEPVRF